MKKSQKLLSMLLAVCMLFSLMPMTALATAITDSSAGGEDRTWTLDIPAKLSGAEATVLRLAGADRFQTAFAVAEELKAQLGVKKFESVIVACGSNFPDALSGSYLAAVKNAPILLSYNKKYNDMAVDYIRKNLDPKGTVYLLGGNKAVPETFESSLGEFRVKRLAGENRFGTNLAILAEAGVDNKPILVCTGLNFADSLSASATEFPILLVYGDELLSDQTAFLKGLQGNDLYVIGGASAVSEAMAQKLAAYGNVDRVAGENRFETSVAIAERFFPSLDSLVLAYGKNFPDGLCGASLASAVDAPLVLTMAKWEDNAAAYAAEYNASDGYVLGGEKLIPDESVDLILGNRPSGDNTPGVVAPEESLIEIREKTFLPNRSADFTFLVSCDWGEEYLKKNLRLTGEKGPVSYKVTAEENDIYRISATEPYEQYKTYRAEAGEDMLFPEYSAKTLEFSIIGPDRAEIVFNEDNLVFLKKLELQQYGASGKYELQWDESAQRYYLTLSELEDMDASTIGKVLCIGDYAGTEEILADGTRDLTFAKVEKISHNAQGDLLLELSVPQVSEVYDELDIYFAEGGGDIRISGDPEMAFAEAVASSDGFAEYLATAYLAAESYASDYGLAVMPLEEDSDDNLTFELTEHTLEEVAGANACKLVLGGKISYTIPLASKEGQPEGSITLTCNATVSSTISVAGEYKDGKGNDGSVNLCLTNTTTTTLSFGMDFKLEYSEDYETVYLVNEKSKKIHTETCRIATKSTNQENLMEMKAQELVEYYEGDRDLMKKNECKVCKAVTGFDGSAYAYNDSTKVLHCADCDRVGNIKECNLYTLYPDNTLAFTTCNVCRPEDRQVRDFDKRMLNAIKGSDWEEQVTAFKDMLGDSFGDEDPAPDFYPELSIPINISGVFNVVLGIEPVIDFEIEASANFSITTSTTNEYGIHNVGEGFETYHNELPGEVEDTYKLSFTGEADAKFGITLSARANPVGLEKAAYIEINGQVGLYGHFSGIFAVEGTLDGQDTDAYCAARLEAGLFARMDGAWKILWFDGDFEIIEEKRLPLFKWGYDRMYYTFEEESSQWTVNGPDQVVILCLADVMDAKYLDLTSMEYDTGVIHPQRIGNTHFDIQVDIENMDGTPCSFLEYTKDSGKIVRKLNTPEFFEASVTINLTPKKPINSLKEFFGSNTKDDVYGCSMDELVVKIIVGERNQELAQDRIIGTYKGSYFATQGETGLTLTVYREGEKNKALFDFYSLPGRTNAKSGKYYMDVTYNANTDEYTFTATQWIDKPFLYEFVNLKGKLVGDELSGEASYANSYYEPQSFSVTRTYDEA